MPAGFSGNLAVEHDYTSFGKFTSQSTIVSGVSPILGLGAMFNVSSNLAIRADWERHFAVGDDSTTGESDIDLITIGAQFSF